MMALSSLLLVGHTQFYAKQHFQEQIMATEFHMLFFVWLRPRFARLSRCNAHTQQWKHLWNTYHRTNFHQFSHQIAHNPLLSPVGRGNVLNLLENASIFNLIHPMLIEFQFIYSFSTHKCTIPCHPSSSVYVSSRIFGS